MRDRCRLASAGALLLPLLLTGCSLFPTTRKLPVPKAPLITQAATPEELVARLNKRWDALNTLNATVEIQATKSKTKEGVATDSPTFRGIIFVRKPEMLRVYGRVPVIGTEMFDMVGDGKNFTLYIPHYSKVYKGSYDVTNKSDSMAENMRPGFFFDALVVRGLQPDDFYSVSADSETLEDAAKKHLYTVPEYVLSITRRQPGSQKETPVRVVTFTRDNLLPYQQDIYDSAGNLETQVFYSAYQDFGGSDYPSTVTIKRPLEEIQIVLTIESVKENQPLADDQFQINNIPAGTPVQKLD